jgi:hypothetical protein
VAAQAEVAKPSAVRSVKGTLAVSVTLSVVLVACGRDSARLEGSPDSGVQGVVVAGPSCPLDSSVTVCPSEPVETEVRVLQGTPKAGTEAGREAGAGGELVTVAHAGSDGQFRINLPPGSYVLEAVPPSDTTLLAKPTFVDVQAHEFTSVTVLLDTAIR